MQSSTLTMKRKAQEKAPYARGEGWSPEVAELIRATVTDVENKSISDQKAYDRLIQAGLTKKQALGVLRTIMAAAIL